MPVDENGYTASTAGQRQSWSRMSSGTPKTMGSNMDRENFFFQAEDGIRDLVRSRGLGDVYKRQHLTNALRRGHDAIQQPRRQPHLGRAQLVEKALCLSLIHI